MSLVKAVENRVDVLEEQIERLSAEISAARLRVSDLERRLAALEQSPKDPAPKRVPKASDPVAPSSE